MKVVGVRVHPVRQCPVLQLQLDAPVDDRCARVWERASTHPNVLALVETRGAVVDVDYAALDLTRDLHREFRESAPMFRYLAEICNAVEYAWPTTTDDDDDDDAGIGGGIGFVDLDDSIRVAFSPGRARNAVALIAQVFRATTGGLVEEHRSIARLRKAYKLERHVGRAQYRDAEVVLGWLAVGDAPRAREASERVYEARYRALFVDALETCDVETRSAPDEPSAATRSRALLAAGRPREALAELAAWRAAEATNVAAHVVHGHVERAIAQVARATGVEQPRAPLAPDHLARLAGAIAAGDVRAAIDELADARFADDAEAQALLAHALATDLRHADAARAFDRALAHARRPAWLVAKAHSLVALGRAAEAIETVAELGPSAAVLALRTRALTALDDPHAVETSEAREVALAAHGSAARVVR